MKHSCLVKSVMSAALLGFLALGLTSTPVLAATAPATFTVSATVQGTCTATATPIAFGIYTGTLVTVTTSAVTVTCTKGTIYNVTLNAGLNTASGSTEAARKMIGQYVATDTLAYTLLAGTTSGSPAWGDGTLGTTAVAGVGNGAGQALPIYATLTGGQTLNPDTYGDTVTATVNY